MSFASSRLGRSLVRPKRRGSWPQEFAEIPDHVPSFGSYAPYSRPRLLRRAGPFLALLLLVAAALADQLPVRIDLQYQLLTKIMSFDRNFKRRTTNEVVIGVLYQKSSPESRAVMAEWISVIHRSSAPSFEGLPPRTVPIEWTDEKSLDAALDRESINILYVTPLSDTPIPAVTSICRARRITTVSGVRDYVTKGIALGFDLKADKVEILINLKSARAEGANFSSSLLRLVQVLED